MTITTTLYTVIDIKSEYNPLVLVKEDEDGLVSAKFLTYGLSGESVPVWRALKAVTGEQIESKLIMKDEFIDLFGRGTALEVGIIG